MAGIVISCLLLTAMSLVGIAFPSVFWTVESWRYRNAEAIEPTAEQYRMYRLRFAAILTLSVPPLIGLAWPGEPQAKIDAWVVSAVGSVALYLGILIVTPIVRRTRRTSKVVPDWPSELSEAGYGAQWFAVAYTLVCALVIAIGYQALAAADRQRAEDRAKSAELREEMMSRSHDDIVESLLSTLPPLQNVERPELPVYTAVDEGAFVVSPSRLQIDDARVVRVGLQQNQCPLVGAVVVESSVNVSFGMVLDVSAAGELDPASFCTALPDNNTYEFIPLAIVLADRPTLTLSGDRMVLGSY